MQISLWSQKFIIVVKASQKFMLLLQLEVQSLFQCRIHHHQPVIKLLFLLFPSFFCIIINGLKLPLTIFLALKYRNPTQGTAEYPHHKSHTHTHTHNTGSITPHYPSSIAATKLEGQITKPLPQLQLEHHTSRQQPTQAYTMDEPSQHFTRTLTEVPRQSKKETGEKRETEREFGFGLKPERSSPTSKVTPIVQSPPKFQADFH